MCVTFDIAIIFEDYLQVVVMINDNKYQRKDRPLPYLDLF